MKLLGRIQFALLPLIGLGAWLGQDAQAQTTIDVTRDQIRVTTSGNPYSGPLVFANRQQRYTEPVWTYGIHFENGEETIMDNNISIANLNGSPILGAHGQGCVLRYTGRLNSAGGQSFPSLVTSNGGKIVLDAQARVNLVLDGSYFTRQFWCISDGTGKIEFDEGFVADNTQLGTVADGLGSIRLANVEFISHHSQSVPKGYRPDNRPGESPKINAHLVYEQIPGGIWTTRTNPQEYVGGLWPYVNMTINTETNLELPGVRTVWPDYTNWGGMWLYRRNVRLTKKGEADLILSGHQGYTDSSSLAITEGRVVFKSDAYQPDVAQFFNGPTCGQFLDIDVEGSGKLLVQTPLLRIKDLSLLSADGEIEIDLDKKIIGNQINLSGVGKLKVNIADGTLLQPGASFQILDFQTWNVNGNPELILEDYNGDITWNLDDLWVTGTIRVATGTILVNTEKGIGTKTSLVVRGNPIQQAAEVDLYHPSVDGKNIIFQVTDMAGRSQKLEAMQLSQGAERSMFLLNRGKLSSGLYQLSVFENGKRLATQRVVLQ